MSGLPVIRVVALAAAASIAACASSGAGNATKGPPAGGAPAPVAMVPSSAVKDAHLSGEDIVALQHAGYKIINKDGQTLYCSTEPRTGSRIAHDNTCMTEKEMVALREETKRNMQNLMRDQPPPQGQ